MWVRDVILFYIVCVSWIVEYSMSHQGGNKHRFISGDCDSHEFWMEQLTMKPKIPIWVGECSSDNKQIQTKYVSLWLKFMTALWVCHPNGHCLDQKICCLRSLFYVMSGNEPHLFWIRFKAYGFTNSAQTQSSNFFFLLSRVSLIDICHENNWRRSIVNIRWQQKEKSFL